MIKVSVASLKLGDVEDPIVFAGGPIIDWQKSDQGQWVMENAIDIPEFNISYDTDTWMGYTVNITANLNEEDYTYWLLKWSK
jgi:hypothetical protein